MTRSELVRAVAAHGLAGSRLRLPARPLPREEWDRLLRIAVFERVPGFLVGAIRDGCFRASAEQAAQAAAVHLASMSVALRLERLLLQLVATLEERSIDYLVLKGPAHAHLLYPDPALRSFGDIDILVTGEQYDHAVRAVTETGGRRIVPELRPGFDRRAGKGATFAVASGDEIDLHRTLVFGPLGLGVPLHDLFSTATSFDIGGRRLPALGEHERFIHACIHATLGSPLPRLVPLRDVAQMLSTRRLDGEQLRRQCREWRAEAVVATAVRQTCEAFQLDDAEPVADWGCRYRPNRREQAALRLYGAEGSYLAQAAASMFAVPDFRSKLAYLGLLASPAAHRRGRGRRAARILQGARAMVGRRR